MEAGILMGYFVRECSTSLVCRANMLKPVLQFRRFAREEWPLSPSKKVAIYAFNLSISKILR